MDKKLSYLEYHLLSLGDEFLKSDIKLNDVKKSFDFKTDINGSAYILEDLLTRNNKSSNNNLSKKAQLSINAFKNLEGENWYPVLRKIKNGNKNLENALFLMSIYDQNKQKEIVNGYKYDKQINKLVLFRKDIKEEDVFSDLKSSNNGAVYTLAIRPCVENLKRSTDRISEEDCYGGGGSGGSNPPTVNQSSLTLGKVKIKIKKESWLEKAEVHLVHYNWKNPIFGKNVIHKAANANLEGRRLAKFRTKDVKKGRTKTVNTFITNENNVYIHYAIFECDNWPAKVRRAYADNKQSKTIYEILFRSWEPEYTSQVLGINVSNTSYKRAFRFSEDNSQITYNFK